MLAAISGDVDLVRLLIQVPGLSIDSVDAVRIYIIVSYSVAFINIGCCGSLATQR